MDLKSVADDLTSIGLPGYYGIRVDCAVADSALLQLAMFGLPALVPGYPNLPIQGRVGTSIPSDPTRAYALGIWIDGDPAPPTGDGQPNWPASTVKSDPLVSSAVIGDIAGLSIDGY